MADHDPHGLPFRRHRRVGRDSVRGGRRRRHARLHRGSLGLRPGSGKDRSRGVAGRGSGPQGAPPRPAGAQGRRVRTRVRPGQLAGPAAVRRPRRTHRRAEDHGRDGRRHGGRGRLAGAVRRLRGGGGDGPGAAGTRVRRGHVRGHRRGRARRRRPGLRPVHRSPGRRGREDAAEFLRRAAGSRAAAELAEGVRQGVHPDDVALCLELDRFPFAMVAASEDSHMVLRPCTVPRPPDKGAV